MQRQSLGSPSSKLHGNGGVAGGEKEEAEVEPEREKIKEEKIRPAAGTPRSVHLIPVLVTLCFLILYLSSHDPTPKDLSSIGGFARILDPKVGVSGSEIGRYLKAARGGVAAIRSHRALKEDRRFRHRKIRSP